jgi:hypothetical protein
MLRGREAALSKHTAAPSFETRFALLRMRAELTEY